MTREYDWNSIEVIITPDVLLVYYLYLRGLDQKAKKMGAIFLLVLQLFTRRSGKEA